MRGGEREREGESHRFGIVETDGERKVESLESGVGVRSMETAPQHENDVAIVVFRFCGV